MLLNLGADDEVRIGEPYLLKGIVNFEVASAHWTPSDSLSAPDSIITFARPNQSTTYSLTAIDANGCSITDVITLFVNRERTVYIPNIFSPKQWGKNKFTFFIVN